MVPCQNIGTLSMSSTMMCSIVFVLINVGSYFVKRDILWDLPNIQNVASRKFFLLIYDISKVII